MEILIIPAVLLLVCVGIVFLRSKGRKRIREYDFRESAPRPYRARRGTGFRTAAGWWNHQRVRRAKQY